MRYPYEDLDDSRFEDLVVEVMRKLFGEGVESFAPGKDGGRDARFSGTAEKFPSTSDPWRGVTIGQAKHTSGINLHFSDRSFSGEDNASSVISKEVPRIKKLVEAGEIDNYILFSNRRLGGTTAPGIEARLAAATGLARENIRLAGVEFLDRALRRYPELIRLAEIDPIDGPLLVSSYEIAEVILAISTELSAPIPVDDAPVVDRVSFDRKNETNAMSAEFAALLEDKYLSYTAKIEKFLADPANHEALRLYQSAVDDFQRKIVAKKRDYQSFDDVFNYLIDFLVKRDGVLSRNRPLLGAMIFYMYWHCDIGETPDAAAQ